MLLNTYTEIRCAVVLHELLRGDKFESRLAAQSVAILREFFPTGVSLECPTDNDWKVAGIAIQQLPDQYHSKECLRKMTNDTLIAAMCCRLNMTLISADKDFNVIKKLKTFSNLQLLPWDVLKQTFDFRV
jgi:predicted nucleic acid-binding protein